MKGEAMTDSTDIGVEQDASASQDANAPRASKRNKFMIPAQQVTEVVSFVSDDFATDAHGYLVPENVKADGDFCLRSGCHDWNDVVASTAGFEGNDAKYNPHASHQDGVLECSDCHKMHRQSALECNECHALNAPEGWGK